MSYLRGFLMIAAYLHFWAGGAAADQKLTGVQIKEAFSGARIYGKIGRFDAFIDYLKSGVTKGVVGTRGSDTGKWWVDGNRLCIKWNVWRKGQTSCRAVSLTGGKSVWYDEKGTVTARWSLPKK